MMLLLFSYPLRKYVRALQGLGKVKWWFWFHLVLGIGGPWLILVHSTFHIGSLNAGVALYQHVRGGVQRRDRPFHLRARAPRPGRRTHRAA